MGHLMQVGRQDDLDNWLQMLTNRLFMRRSGNAQIPFIEGHNSLDLIFEFTATGKKPPEFCDSSSVYLMCLMELLCSLPKERRDELLRIVYYRIVLGQADCGTQMEGCEPIDLMLWIAQKIGESESSTRHYPMKVNARRFISRHSGLPSHQTAKRYLCR